MKKNLNVIQIKGVRGLLMLLFVGSCLFAGFAVFPGWVAMHLWNYMANYGGGVPSIGLLQGILLWGIIVAAYFTFRKERIVVCVKSPQGLDEEELKAVFANLKKQAGEDKIIQSMIKAREAELKIKDAEQKSDIVQNNEVNKS